jgi:hypothetical protein
VALPVASRTSARERVLVAALSLTIVGVTLTGRLDALPP